MSSPVSIERRDLLWYAIILVTTGISLLATSIGLLFGITTGIPHLLYIPVVIASYMYPRRGAAFAVGVGVVYLLLVILLAETSSTVLLEAAVRTLVIIAIGWLVAMLTRRLREQEDLYQGLFDHSEAGSMLVSGTTGARTIDELNWRAANLLRRRVPDLKGRSLDIIWDRNEADGFFGRLARDGAVYAAETTFSLPDEGSFFALVSAASLPGNRAVLTFFDITDRVHAEHALQKANDKLNLLSRFTVEHIHQSVDEVIETVNEAEAAAGDPAARGYLERIRALAWDVARQLFLTESYKDLGTRPQVWMPVQRTFDSARFPPGSGPVSVRIWAGRLEIYADPLFADALTHLLENPVRHGSGIVKNIIVTYHETRHGLDLVFRDDGQGVPDDRKQQIFEYDAGGHAGIGLFICRQIADVTGMTITETGIFGKGAVFVIHVPEGMFRIEGTAPDIPALPAPAEPFRFPVTPRPGVTVRELLASEFAVAESLWVDYHNTKGDAGTDRIFAAFHEGRAVSLARCRRHPDGFEVDGVFTPTDQRGHGYANAVVAALVEACGRDTLYMHSVRGLEKFYGSFGFVPIGEKELPPTIRERFAWAGGEMEGANVNPMRRDADLA